MNREERERLTRAIGVIVSGAHDRLEAMNALMVNLVFLWGEGGGHPSLELIHKTIDDLAKREAELRGRKREE